MSSATFEQPLGGLTSLCSAQFPPERGLVAVFLDWENLKYGLRDAFEAAPDLAALKRVVREIGRAVVWRAYADWAQPSLRSDMAKLYRHGIEPVYAPGSTPTGGIFKNSADHRLMIDATALACRMPEIKTFVLVSGDGDLIHCLNFLRGQGVDVVVVGVGEALSKQLAGAADSVIRYERDVVTLVDQRESFMSAIARIETLLRDSEQAGGRQEMLLSQLGLELVNYCDLDVRKQLNCSLKEVILRAVRAGRLRLRTEDTLDFVSLSENTRDCPTPGERSAAEVGLDLLTEDEQRALLHFLYDLGHCSRYLTFSYVVNHAVTSSVLPWLSRWMLVQLINRLVEDGLLLRETGPHPDNPEATVTLLRLNDEHPLMLEWRQPAQPEALAADD